MRECWKGGLLAEDLFVCCAGSAGVPACRVTTGVIDKYLAGEDACGPSTLTNGQARLPELTLKRSGIYSRSTLTCPLLSSGER